MDLLRPASFWWPVVALCTAWSAVFLADQGVTGALLILGYAAGSLLLARSAAAGALVVCATQSATLLAGIPATSAAGLAAGLVSLAALGLFGRPRTALPLLALYLGIIWATGLPVVRTLVGFALFAATYALARTLHRRCGRVEATQARARDLAGRDVQEMADRIVGAERQRLVTASLAVLGSALDSMQADARRAGGSLDAGLIERVQQRGSEAVDELRSLLTLLRPAPVLDPPTPSGPGRPWRTDALLALGVGVVGLVELVVADEQPTGWATTAVGSLLCAALVLRRQATAVAVLTGAAAVSAAAMLEVPLAHGLAEGTALALLSWGAVHVATPWSLTGWGLLGIGAVSAAAQSSLGYSAVAAAIVLVSAASAWRARCLGRELGDADDLIDRLDAAVRQIVGARIEDERARIARDLHDVTSHAVGVMVLHAGAAHVLRERNPDAARESLDLVAAVGAGARSELALLAGSMTSRDDGDFVATVKALGEMLCAAGMQVHPIKVAALSPGPVADAVLRVVQESLTNAVKHAPGAPVEIRIVEEGSTIEVIVHNGARGRPRVRAVTLAGCGAGLAGLRDRVEILAGRLDAAPASDGGFTVRAVLPNRSVPALGGES